MYVQHCRATIKNFAFTRRGCTESYLNPSADHNSSSYVYYLIHPAKLGKVSVAGHWTDRT